MTKTFAVKETDINQLVPYENNPRLNDKAVSKVAASIEEFGFQQPIVVDEHNVVIAGHTRLRAALSLGLAKVPVHIAEGLSPAQVRAYRIADNRSAEDASWDDILLTAEVVDLQTLGFDLGQTGLSENEINKLLSGNSRDASEDLTLVVPVDTIVQPGDTWLLGKHRLFCGDATEKENTEILFDGVKPHIMVTDPPYGVNYDPKWRFKAGFNKNTEKLGDVKNDDRADWTEAWKLFPGIIAYIWHSGVHASEVQNSIEQAGFNIRSQIIWVKDRFALSRGDYHWQHEPCWYAVRDKEKGGWMGDRSQTTIWNIVRIEDEGHGHGTQKPVECMRRPIINNSSPGQAVYDPFVGSGTTLIAAESEDRICYAMEVDPVYVDVTIRRWQEYTGQEATREKGGEKYNVLSKEIIDARTKTKTDKPKVS